MLKTSTKTVKARIVKGHIVPFEDLGLREGDELEVTATVSRSDTYIQSDSPTTITAGAWGDQLDCEIFESDVYMGRLTSNRPAVSL